MTKASPIYWKAKTSSRVCQSSKDAKTLNVSRMVDDSIFRSTQVKILLYGDYKKRIQVNFFTDSEATLESIASSFKANLSEDFEIDYG